ncbi:DUF3307 domain-containing protein [Chloroflexi bacterium TSY]|nr:DUF3307 domain-containing protein [Chloroflexi bacterium TSY]
MYLTATLLLGHLLADFPLQTNWIFKMKSKNWLGVALHAAIHVLTTALLLKSSSELWPLLFALGALHFLCDWAKLHYTSQNQLIPFLVDQIAHLFVLVLLAVRFPFAEPVLPAWIVYPAVVYGFVPAILIFVSIMATDIARQQEPRHAFLKWAHHRGLSVSQAVGNPLVASIAFVLVYLALTS